MAVLFSIYRDNRKEGTHRYYGRAVHLNTIGTDQLADRIQANCSMKKSDVLAVINELVEVMTIELQNSNIVRLDGFGAFKINLKTYGADTKDEFKSDTNIKSARVNFLPKGMKTNGVMTRAFVNGVKYKRYGE